MAATDVEMEVALPQRDESLANIEPSNPQPKKRALEVASSGDAQQQPECVQCKSTEIKYRCPRCERITCSLACCVAHKKEFDCNGKRDRTKYISTKQFTDSDLASDYFFLEEIVRSTATAARSRTQLGVNVKQFGQAKQNAKKRRVGANGNSNGVISMDHGGVVNPHVSADWLSRFPVAFQLLVQHAAKRGVALTLLAPGMSKRVRNTSYMNMKESKLLWRVEWVFPSAEVPVSLFEERAEDSLTPFELLAKYLDRRLDNTATRNKLKKYSTGPAWRDEVVLLIRKEFAPSAQPQYYQLDGHQTLESNLKRKAVVEFPVITVVLRSDLGQYHVVNDMIEIVPGGEAPAVGGDEGGEQDGAASEPEEAGDDEL